MWIYWSPHEEHLCFTVVSLCTSSRSERVNNRDCPSPPCARNSVGLRNIKLKPSRATFLLRYIGDLYMCMNTLGL